MLGALRRKVASGGSSSLVLGKSLLAIRSGVSVSRVSCNAGKEILLLQPRGIAHVRNFSHLVLPGPFQCIVHLLFVYQELDYLG
ncbi:uncharacterized protein LOC111287315 isoform X5 [Durio zibethinus]|uniref:Uncharacterized protein LOC111287315 isoform X5 n=1 Tax=Durio zibethinus TaxID=66656 RepID=A0A6P5XZH3_DURZI|nr:uncharacterized protein LOC111287315 isoform X5 [Durio zibethinus]